MSPAQQLREIEIAGRPATVLIARHGDPGGSVAMAFASADDDPAQAQAITALITARLEAAGHGLLTSSSLANGGYVTGLARTPDEAGALIEAIDVALAEVVTGKEVWLDNIALELESARSGAPEAGGPKILSRCSLAFASQKRSSGVLNARSDAGIQQLNTARIAVRQTSRVRFAAVGGPKHIDAVQSAVEALAPWPSGSAPSPGWPKDDRFAVAPAAGGTYQLAISVRLPTAGRALETASTLGDPASALAVQLAALGHGWQVDTLSGEADLAGGCLLLHLRPASSSPGLPLAEVARAARLAVDEVERVAAGTRETAWTKAAAILRSEDPRRAAAAAAWRALSVAVDEPARTSVTWYSDEIEGMSGEDFRRLYDRFGAYWEDPGLELKIREEPGQGDLWVLLATPCGTGVEGRQDAGLGALALNAAARASNGRDGVAFEPWVAADGLGLVAHAARREDGETSEELATRVAESLGDALLPREATVGAFLEAKRAGLRLLGPPPRAGYWTALEALSPEHPSWLLPEGTWDAVAGADVTQAGTRLRMMLSGPLRVATLTNGGAQQGEVLRATLARWLRPFRAEPRRCPATSTPVTPRWGLTRLEVTEPTDRAISFVGAALPTYGAPLDDEARFTAWLLDRHDGWLETALLQSRLTSSAKAHLLGGPKAAAIIVEVAALPEQRDAAEMQVRALFARLASGAVSDADVAAARRYFAEAELLTALDPRHRIVRLWRGQPETKAEVSREDLRLFHRQAFSSERVVVVDLAAEP